MKQKRPKHCKGCISWHNAGHKEGSPLYKSRYNNWCCRLGQHAPHVISICIQQGKKNTGDTIG